LANAERHTLKRSRFVSGAYLLLGDILRLAPGALPSEAQAETPFDEVAQGAVKPPDGSAPSLLFESAPAPFRSGGSPVWSPDGTQIAFEQPSEHARKLLRRTGEAVWLVANADGTGDAREIDELRYLSWRGGWYSCGCYRFAPDQP
jgi:hypothetical protein